jgi:hypothetical protein
VDIKNTADPWDDLKISKVVEKSLSLNGVNWGDLSVGIAGTNVREDVPHAMAGKQISKLLDLLIVSEECLVFPILLEPEIISEPAMLDPDPVGPAVMSAVTNAFAG